MSHIQKRMGSGLMDYKRKKKGQKLADTKSVGGPGCLTDAFIDRMLNNYGEAIGNNNDVPSMKTVILAIYHHMIKDDELSLVQQHMHCPKTTNTRLKYWQDKLHSTLRIVDCLRRSSLS